MNNTSDKNIGFSNNTENQLRQQATQQRQPLGQTDRIEAELNILDDDYMMSSPFVFARNVVMIIVSRVTLKLQSIDTIFKLPRKILLRQCQSSSGS